MNLLLDTHILLWWLTDSPRLPDQVRKTISRAEAVTASAVSGWEIESKRLRGLLKAPDDLEATLAARDIGVLSITMAHAIASARLPLHHRDPFDRLLVAQALAESLTLVTHDEHLKAYRVPMLLA